jgi:hypothetical protein
MWHTAKAGRRELNGDLMTPKRSDGRHEIIAVLAFALAQSGTPAFTEVRAG